MRHKKRGSTQVNLSFIFICKECFGSVDLDRCCEDLIGHESQVLKTLTIFLVKDVFQIVLESDDLIHSSLHVVVIVSDHDLGQRSLDASEISILEVFIVLEAGSDIKSSHVLIQVSLAVVESLEEINDLSFWQAVKAVLI